MKIGPPLPKLPQKSKSGLYSKNTGSSTEASSWPRLVA